MPRFETTERDHLKGQVGNLVREAGRSPRQYRDALARLVQVGLLSESKTGNYSILINGQQSNYHLDGKELFLTEFEDADNLALILRMTHPDSSVDVRYVRN